MVEEGLCFSLWVYQDWNDYVKVLVILTESTGWDSQSLLHLFAITYSIGWWWERVWGLVGSVFSTKWWGPPLLIWIKQVIKVLLQYLMVPEKA